MDLPPEQVTLATLAFLPFDCLHSIFDKVGVRDLLHLRETARLIRQAVIEYLDTVFLPRVGYPRAEEGSLGCHVAAETGGPRWHLGWTVMTTTAHIYIRNGRLLKIWPTTEAEFEQPLNDPIAKTRSRSFLMTPRRPSSTPPIDTWFGLHTVRATQTFLLTADIIENRILQKWREWDHYCSSNHPNDWSSAHMNLLFGWIFFQCASTPSETRLGLFRHPSLRQHREFHVLPLADFLVHNWRIFPTPVILIHNSSPPVEVRSNLNSFGVSLHALLAGLRVLAPAKPTGVFLTNFIERNNAWHCTFDDSPLAYRPSNDPHYARPRLGLDRALPPGESRLFVLVHHFATGRTRERRHEPVGMYTNIEAAGAAMEAYGRAAAASTAAFTYLAGRYAPGRRLPLGYDYQGEVWMQVKVCPVGRPPSRDFEEHVVWERKWFQDGRAEIERRWDRIEGGAAGEVEVETLYEAMKEWVG